MNIPYIINSKGLTFYVNGVPVLINSDDCRYGDILKLINKPTKENEDKLRAILNETQKSFMVAKTIETLGNYDNFTFFKENGQTQLKYKNYLIEGYLSQKLIELFVGGCTDFSHFGKFVEKLYSNPSETSRKELYYFLEYQSLPITQDGNFIAYKSVLKNGYSSNGNTNTRVIQGKVNTAGQILNEVGAVIEVEREDVNNDRDVGCATGLHVGSFSYASNFSEKLLAVEVNPKDVVSVPHDCNNQKCRVCKYKVLNYIEQSINSPDVVVESTEIKVPVRKSLVEETSSAKNEMLSFANRQKTLDGITRNIKSHGNKTTIAQLCGSVGRRYQGCSAPIMVAVCCELGFNVVPSDWARDACGKMIVSIGC